MRGTIYSLFCSMFSLMFLHFFLYGCNIFMWRKTRINYSFIFEQSPRRELKYRDVFLICTISMTFVVGVLFVHISLMDKGYSYSQVESIPGLLLLVMYSPSTFLDDFELFVWHRLKDSEKCLMLSITGLFDTACVSHQHHLQVKPLPSA